MNRRGFLRSIFGVVGAKALEPLAAVVAPVASEVISVTFPEHGKYTMGIDTAEWSDTTRIIIFKARSLGITTYPLLYGHRYLFKNNLTDQAPYWYIEKDMRFSRFHTVNPTAAQTPQGTRVCDSA